ncbi:type II toxin-antitoxin system HigB family toxin [Flavihumibacter petaseus]|uniref:type II toxin-antitoxin system HigB family toxin n=1 Tax=Flavihumibacter petaseus TaxID=549295 RepID=UPI001C3F3B30
MRWYIICKENDWQSFSVLKQQLPGTDYVGNDLYVFNTLGNKYRLIARIFFNPRTIFVKFIGTHADYDRVRLSDL